MISLLAFFFVLGILIIVHELGHFFAAKKAGVRVEKLSLGFGPRLISKKKNDTEYNINLIPLGGYVKMAGDSQDEYKGNPDEYFYKTPQQRAQIILMGPLLNYLSGILFFWLILVAGYPMLTNKVGGLIDGYGAKEAGLKVADKIIAVDGKKVEFFEDIQKIIQGKTGAESVELSVDRNNRIYQLSVRIKEKAVDDNLGKKRNVGLIGITPADEIIMVKHGFFESFGLAVKKTLGLTAMTYKAFWRMITGNLSMRDSVTGPLGLFYITSRVAHLGPIALFHLIAVLSISLAIFNMLPFPVLDGGHVLLLLIERIRGKAISARAEHLLARIGISTLLLLAAVVTYNDILRFFAEKASKGGIN